MSLIAIRNLLVTLSLLACSSVFATPLLVDLTGIESQGQRGDSTNTVLTFDVGANSVIRSIDYTVTLDAYSPSWLSEMLLTFEDSSQFGSVSFRPGFGQDRPGTASETGFLDLAELGLSFAVGSDGILRLEFHEIFDDISGADGIWGGSLTFGVEPVTVNVPEPASSLLLGAGLVLLACAGRRRHAAHA